MLAASSAAAGAGRKPSSCHSKHRTRLSAVLAADAAQRLVDEALSVPRLAAEDAQRRAQEAVDSAKQTVDKVLTLPAEAAVATKKAAETVMGLPVEAARAAATTSAGLEKGINNLKAAPGELSSKLSGPFLTASEVAVAAPSKLEDVSETLQESVAGLQSAAASVARIPSTVKTRLLEPLQLAESTVKAVTDLSVEVDRTAASVNETFLAAQAATTTLVNLPGRLRLFADSVVSRAESAAAASRRLVIDVVSFPQRFANQVTDALWTAQRSAEAAAAIPGQVAATAKAVAEFPQRTKESVEEAVGNVVRTVDNVVSLPGKLKAGVEGAVTGVQQTVSTIVAVPDKIQATIVGVDRGLQEAQRVAANVVELPGRVAERVGGAVGTVAVLPTQAVEAARVAAQLPERTAASVEQTVAGVQWVASAVSVLPAQAEQAANEVASFPDRLKASVDKTVSEVQEKVDAVVSFPGQVQARVDETAKRVQRTADAVASVPSDLRAKFDGVVAIGTGVVQVTVAVASGLHTVFSWVQARLANTEDRPKAAALSDVPQPVAVKASSLDVEAAIPAALAGPKLVLKKVGRAKEAENVRELLLAQEQVEEAPPSPDDLRRDFAAALRESAPAAAGERTSGGGRGKPSLPNY